MPVIFYTFLGNNECQSEFANSIFLNLTKIVVGLKTVTRRAKV
jgi:hypothetical protein